MSIHYTYGTMFAGKTHAMVNFVQQTHLSTGAELVVYRVVPTVTHTLRTAEGDLEEIDIKSRSGVSCKGYEIGTDDMPWVELAEIPNNTVVIDEAQFLSHAQVQTIVNNRHTLGLHFHCYGLKSDILGNHFEGSAALMAVAQLHELMSVCECGSLATMNGKVPSETSSETCSETRPDPLKSKAHIDTNSSAYVPLCDKCWFQMMGGAHADNAGLVVEVIPMNNLQQGPPRAKRLRTRPV